ncbi:MAG: DUF2490 domain-containing protein [Pyrinomonadaceae bacterium]
MNNFIFIAGYVVFAFAAAAVDGRGQQQPQDDIQSWSEVQLTIPMDKRVDFFTAVQVRIGNNTTRLADARHSIGFNWKPHATLSVLPFYTFIGVRNSTGRFRNEHRLNLRATYRFPFKSFGLSHRSTVERRLRQPINSWRYRPSFTVEKDLPKSWIADAKVFATDEIFYDSTLNKFSRNRFTVGLSKTLNKNLTLDTYYMRQNDGFSRPGDLHVIGTVWRIRP